ncbi:MAG: hypothetical protein JWN44_2835 [Myxococcales bacterium]|nr:hypothetical protein [Myxococcales bacterium]
MRDHVPGELAAAILRDPDGYEHRASELWATRPALVLWVRHFG